jgi:hypothetical protein
MLLESVNGVVVTKMRFTEIAKMLRDAADSPRTLVFAGAEDAVKAARARRLAESANTKAKSSRGRNVTVAPSSTTTEVEDAKAFTPAEVSASVPSEMAPAVRRGCFAAMTASQLASVRLFRTILRAAGQMPTRNRVRFIRRRARQAFDDARAEAAGRAGASDDRVRYLQKLGETQLETIQVQANHLAQFADAEDHVQE